MELYPCVLVSLGGMSASVCASIGNTLEALQLNILSSMSVSPSDVSFPIAKEFQRYSYPIWGVNDLLADFLPVHAVLRWGGTSTATSGLA
jgi:hypothetical protein